MESNIFWHTQTTEQAFAGLKSQPSGLSQVKVTERTLQYGANEIQAAKRISAWEILLEQFKNILILILLGATAISLFLGHGIELHRHCGDCAVCGFAGFYSGISRRTRH